MSPLAPNTKRMDEVLSALGLDPMPQALSSQKTLASEWSQLLHRSALRLSQHGDLPDYLDVLAALSSKPRNSGSPPLETGPSPAGKEFGPLEREERRLDTAAPYTKLPELEGAQLIESVTALSPWKKGPLSIEGQGPPLELDAEWRSDFKWQRLERLGVNFKGRRVLDVGTGNGYFLYRIVGAGARHALGLEPGALPIAQYLLLQRLYEVDQAALLPLPCDQFIQGCRAFDTVLSMGVLYHRRSPLDHLMQLRSFLRPGGELILETIAVPGPPGHSLVPEGRYAQMRNVFFLPTPSTLESWLVKVGFQHVHLDELVTTKTTEQRSTRFMSHPSLDEFLEPCHSEPDSEERKTREGHPRPRRLIARAWAP